LGRATAAEIASERPQVLIIRDTRESGHMLESALAAGMAAAGADVYLGGILPTPAAAILVRRHGFDLGAVVSASHNPWGDNGIKFFDRDGRKLDDDAEMRVEARVADGPATGSASGRIRKLEGARDDYLRELGTAFDLDLSHCKVILDCANGATYRVAPAAFERLGAEVVAVAIEPDGRNINEGCGSTRPDLLKLTVSGVRAHVGFALDGDGDRVVMVDERGNLIDGDQLLYDLACDRLQSGQLRGPVIGTVMSNLGLELALKELGVDFRRAKVGDRHVLSMLKEHGGVLGGETSGHVICFDKTTTGDGLVTALQVLAIMRRTGKSLSELARGMAQLPQTLLNVRVARPVDPHGTPAIRAAVEEIELALGERGRVVLRASGTEPVIRVMVEGEERDTVEGLAARLAESVRSAFGP
jgi:phosphoglucosamine mutase